MEKGNGSGSTALTPGNLVSGQPLLALLTVGNLPRQVALEGW